VLDIVGMPEKIQIRLIDRSLKDVFGLAESGWK